MAMLKIIGQIAAWMLVAIVGAIGLIPGFLAFIVEAWNANPQGTFSLFALVFTMTWLYFFSATLAVGSIGSAWQFARNYIQKRRQAT